MLTIKDVPLGTSSVSVGFLVGGIRLPFSDPAEGFPGCHFPLSVLLEIPFLRAPVSGPSIPGTCRTLLRQAGWVLSLRSSYLL